MTIDCHWRHTRRQEENQGGVSQKNMRGFIKQYEWHYNHRFENKRELMMKLFDYDLGTSKDIEKMISWEHGDPFWKRRRPGRRKGIVFKDEWSCPHCPSIVRDQRTSF